MNGRQAALLPKSSASAAQKRTWQAGPQGRGRHGTRRTVEMYRYRDRDIEIIYIYIERDIDIDMDIDMIYSIEIYRDIDIDIDTHIDIIYKQHISWLNPNGR